MDERTEMHKNKQASDSFRYDLLQRARRMAQRSRAATACLPCKAGKARCNDYRPCARCKKAGGTEICSDPQSTSQTTCLETIGSNSVSKSSLHPSMTRVELDSDEYQPFTRASTFPPFSTYSTNVHPEAQYSWKDSIGLARGEDTRPYGAFKTTGAPTHLEQVREFDSKRTKRILGRGPPHAPIRFHRRS